MQPSDTSRGYHLSKLTLKGNRNWQLWKSDVTLSAKFLKLNRILDGSDQRPRPLTQLPDGSSDEEKREYQSQMSMHLSTEESFLSRESGLHVALNNCIDEHHRIMTMHCRTPKDIWNYLTNLYENQESDHILELIDKFDMIRLKNAADIPRFLDEIKSTDSSLKIAGKGYCDEELALRIVKKFPPPMEKLRMMLRFGHRDMMKLDNVMKTLIRYHQDMQDEINHQKHSPSDLAAMARHKKLSGRSKNIDKSNSQCHGCQEFGHWRNECPHRKNQFRSFTKKNLVGKSEQAHIAMCAFSGDEASPQSAWIVDTAATAMMSPLVRPDNFQERKIETAGGVGIVSPAAKSSVNIGPLRIHDVLAVPQLTSNLFSVGSACDDGVIDCAVFNRNECIFWKNGKKVMTGNRTGRLYLLDDGQNRQDTTTESALMTLDTWHERLCHI